jgi:hypothetical protein
MSIADLCDAACKQCSIERALVLAAKPSNPGTLWHILRTASLQPGAACDTVQPQVDDAASFYNAIVLLQEAKNITDAIHARSDQLVDMQEVKRAHSKLAEAQQSLKHLHEQMGAASPVEGGAVWYSLVLAANRVLNALPPQSEDLPPLLCCALCQRWAGSSEAKLWNRTVVLASSHMIPEHAFRQQPAVKRASSGKAKQQEPLNNRSVCSATAAVQDLRKGYYDIFCGKETPNSCEVSSIAWHSFSIATLYEVRVLTSVYACSG